MRHLPRFAEAAEALGRNAAAPPLAETGPREVRRAAAAFNEMARRVRAYLDERTHMLAAVSHDLRTQLTRLAMRLEYVSDANQQARAREDVAQMTRLLDSVLAFSREDRAEEPAISIDIGTLLDTLADDERGLGHRAEYHGPIHCVIDGRPTALRRAFTNLIDNAVRYGGEADITLSSDDDRVVVEIADRGPGIPAADRARVLQPFQRLEPSRNRTTGGTGLGLAIAHTVVSAARRLADVQRARRRRSGGSRGVDTARPDDEAYCGHSRRTAHERRPRHARLLLRSGAARRVRTRAAQLPERTSATRSPRSTRCCPNTTTSCSATFSAPRS